MDKESCEQFFREWDGQIVEIKTSDGETMRARVNWFQDEYDDVIVDVIETDRPEFYKVDLRSSAFTVEFNSIQSVRAPVEIEPGVNQNG